MYEMSVGHGANFLLNIGPDARGLLPEKDVLRLRELGAEIRRRYEHPLPHFSSLQAESKGVYSITASSPMEVDRVILQEDVLASETSSFRLYAHLPGYQSKRVCVYQGSTIGHKAICVFPVIRTARLVLEVENDAPAILSMQAFFPG